MIRPRGVGPRLGASWEGRPADLLAALAGVVDVLEILPDCLAGPAGIVPARLAELDALAPDLPVTYHGIGLSIGTVGGWNDDYLHLLDTLWEWRKPLWHSEHLGFTTVSGSSLGAMPALPCTPEAARVLMGPAEIALTRIPFGPRSEARYRTDMSSAALATPITL